jgi:hypothetical protein
MTEQERTPWQGDWQLRLRTKLEALGFEALEDFLTSNPGVGYVKLAATIQDANIAAMQIYGEQIRSAAQRGNLRVAAMDCLVRFLNEYIKRGWGIGRHFPHRLASAYAAWSTAINANCEANEALEMRLRAILARLESSQPVEGWLPKDINDPIIQSCFADVWQPE